MEPGNVVCITICGFPFCLPRLSSPLGCPPSPTNTALEQICSDLDRRHCHPIPCSYIITWTSKPEALTGSQGQHPDRHVFRKTKKSLCWVLVTQNTEPSYQVPFAELLWCAITLQSALHILSCFFFLKQSYKIGTKIPILQIGHLRAKQNKEVG